MIEKVKDWRPSMDWADLIFLTDNVQDMREIDGFRKQGFPVFGASHDGAQLELDRSTGQEFLVKHGIDVLPYEEFAAYDEAEAYVRANMKRYVSKPSGDADKALSYVSKSPADMIYMLQRWKGQNKLKGDFILQEFKQGIEIAVGGWIGPQGFCGPWFENFEHKKLFSGELGPNTGEMATVGRYCTDSALGERLLRPLEKSLAELGITGYVDLNTIVDEEGVPWPMEFTVRPGWPTLNLQCALHEGDPVEWMLDLVNGEDSLVVTDKVCTGLVLAIPDFPYSQLTSKDLDGYPVYKADEIEPEHLHWCEVMIGSAPLMRDDEVVDGKIEVTAGDYVLVATGAGSTAQESVIAAYANIEKVEMPNSSFYRTDIGERVAKELPQLQAQGLCESWPAEAD